MPLTATQYGFNSAEAGYPSRGLTGALVTAKSIHKVVVGPSNLILQSPQDPDNAQLDRQGQTKYYARPGQGLVNAAIVSAGSIGSVNQVGLSQSSEIAAGYHYRSFEAGLEPVRAKSHIGKFRQRGDLVDSVVSASYRPNDGVYGNGNDTAGPGTIKGAAPRPALLDGSPDRPERLRHGNLRQAQGRLPAAARRPPSQQPRGAEALSTEKPYGHPGAQRKDAVETSRVSRLFAVLLGGQGVHHRQSAVPQVRPAPNPEVRSRSPGAICPSRFISSRAIGIDPPEVFP